jgi:hypothetical protein
VAILPILRQQVVPSFLASAFFFNVLAHVAIYVFALPGRAGPPKHIGYFWAVSVVEIVWFFTPRRAGCRCCACQPGWLFAAMALRMNVRRARSGLAGWWWRSCYMR